MGEICFFSLAISMYILNFGTWDIASSLIDYSFVVVDDGKATYFANPVIGLHLTLPVLYWPL
jgi:hypothetical protein